MLEAVFELSRGLVDATATFPNPQNHLVVRLDPSIYDFHEHCPQTELKCICLHYKINKNSLLHTFTYFTNSGLIKHIIFCIPK